MYLGPPRKIEGLDDEDLEYLTREGEEETSAPLATSYSPIPVDPVSGIYLGGTSVEKEEGVDGQDEQEGGKLLELVRHPLVSAGCEGWEKDDCQPLTKKSQGCPPLPRERVGCPPLPREIEGCPPHPREREGCPPHPREREGCLSLPREREGCPPHPREREGCLSLPPWGGVERRRGGREWF